MKTKLEKIREESLNAIREAVDPAGLDALREQSQARLEELKK